MAGLLAASMLRRLRPVVYERQTLLPDNHGALLRFRSDLVARETGMPFRQVRVLKAVKSGGRLRPVSTLADANLYSYKVTGAVEPRSVLDLAPCDRYIAPPDFLRGLANGADITYGREMTGQDLFELRLPSDDDAVISTIPMPVLMQIAGWQNPPRFDYRPVWSVALDFVDPRVDVYQTIYYPEPEVPYYRASMTGARLILEYTSDPQLLPPVEHRATTTTLNAILSHVRAVTDDFGLPKVPGGEYIIHEPKRQEYGKLLPLSDRARQEFILAMTDTYNVYSVGRFATWRQILLDDVVEDVRAVERMITQRSSYHRRLASSRR